MKLIMIYICMTFIMSCGKTELDQKNTSPSTSSSLTTYSCYQVPECLKACGTNPQSLPGYTGQGTHVALVQQWELCKMRKVQITNGVIVYKE